VIISIENGTKVFGDVVAFENLDLVVSELRNRVWEELRADASAELSHVQKLEG